MANAAASTPSATGPLGRLGKSLLGLVAPDAKPPLSDFDRAVAEIDGEEAEALREVSELEAGAAAAALADARTADEHDQRLLAARRRLDRARSRREAVQIRRAERAAEEADQAARARHTEHADRVAAMQKKFAAEHNRIMQTAANLIRDVGLIDAETDEINRALPAGLPALAHVEAIRDVPGQPEQVVKVEIISLWCPGGSDSPLAPMYQSEVHDEGNGRGHRILRQTPHSGASTTMTSRQDCRLVKFRRTTFRPATPGRMGARLARTLDAPGLRAGDRPIWAPLDFWRAEPTSVLRELERIAALPADEPMVEDRDTQVRLELADASVASAEPQQDGNAILGATQNLSTV